MTAIGDELVVEVGEIKSSISGDAIAEGRRQLVLRLSFVSWTLHLLGYSKMKLIGILFLPRMEKLPDTVFPEICFPPNCPSPALRVEAIL